MNINTNDCGHITGTPGSADVSAGTTPAPPLAPSPCPPPPAGTRVDITDPIINGNLWFCGQPWNPGSGGGGGGSVTSVGVSGGTTGLTTSGGPIITSGTITLAGTLNIANGGTGATTATAAMVNLLPTQTGNAGKVLATDGLGNLSWVASSSGITVGATTITGGTSGHMVYDSAGVFGEASAITTNGAAQLTVGSAGTTGAITLVKSGTGAGVTLQSGSTASWTMILPTGDGANGQFLMTNGTGQTLWQAISTAAQGGTGAVQYNDGTNQFAGTQEFTYSNSGVYSELFVGSGGTFGKSGAISLARQGSMGGTTIIAGANTNSWQLTLPPGPGTNGQFLQTNGAGVTSWASAGAGSVTSVAVSGGTTGLTTSGGPITSSGTITLAGTLAIANGGTNATTANAAFNNLAPSQTGNGGKFLTTDGTNTSWAAAGSVTSVGVSGGTTGLTTSGGPITSSGTVTLAGTLLPANGGTGLASATIALGDILVGNTATAFRRLALGTTGQYLMSNGTDVVWAAGLTGTTTGAGVFAGQKVFLGIGAAGYDPTLPIIYNQGITAVGFQAGNTAGSSIGADSTLIGNQAGLTATGANVTCVGSNSGTTLTSGSNGVYIGRSSAASSAAATGEIVIGASATGKGSDTGFIRAVSGVYQGNNLNVWSTTSDERIKENIVDVEGALGVINALRPVHFTYKLTGKADTSFIAQEYAKVLPEHICEHAASPEEKELTGSDTVYGLASNLVPYLVKAIQELSAKNDELTATVEALKSRFN